MNEQSRTEEFYGKDCPEGMVQVEFVGCSPDNKRGEYGWKPQESAFIDVYVDGKRFYIKIGNFHDGVAQRRGLHIITNESVVVEKTAINACSILHESIEDMAKRERGQS